MHTPNYTLSQITTADRIYIDTSALMNSEELEILIKRIRIPLMQEEKKILVSRAVCLELARHLESTDERKQQLALQAFEVLAANQEVFELENSDLTSQEVFKAFADAEILATLTEKRPDYKQLLITNDKRLGHDAYDLNNLESCRGHEIRVCYINRAGELHACEKVCHEEIKSMEPEIREVIHEVVKEVKVPEPQKKEPWYVKTGRAFTLLATGYVICTYKSEIINLIKKVA